MYSNYPYRRPTKISEYGLKRIPDYTEMAYKEAVSKLRYFLSGNYAPSVRSFGGSPSIKNLDESDGDLDKKYSPYSALSSQTRPRLTTKYATLYADSLNNFTPKHTANVNVTSGTSPASGGDVSGTNPDVINFIQKQEEYIEQLERESQYCRDELNNLLGKVKEVISENEHLHEAQKNKLITRMFHSYNAGSETDDLDDVGDSTGLDSDNKISPSKARKSSKYRSSSKLEGPNIVFESRIAELEAQLTQAKIDMKKIQEENNENKRKLASGLVDSTCLDGFKRQIDNLQRDKSALESQISKLKLSLETRDDTGYKRNDAVEQQLREERNNLEAELRRLKDELSKERSKVRELAGEGTRRAVAERSAAEQRYHAHFDELQHDLAAQYDNVAKLQLDLERQRREENELKRELAMKNAAIEELKMELKNKTASLQADLAQAHAEKASLEEELASARLAIERHQRQSKHETNRLNSEIQSLRQRLDRADADLVHSRRENLRLSDQISTLEKELNMKNLTPITPEKKKKEKELSSMLESMENKHAKTVAELETMIQSQNSLMEKLTGECRLLTDKLDDANRRHKTERTQLLCRNSELMRKLRDLWCTHKKYCTTTVPLRSYTPISGYPYSRSSYDLDRTYYTSTPYTNRLRRSESREELATLQRQVNSLGRSLQSTPRTPPSNYQAPTPQPTAAYRDVPPSSDHGREHPGVDSPHHPASESTTHRPISSFRNGDQTGDIGETGTTGITEPTYDYNEPKSIYKEPTPAYDDSTANYNDPTPVYNDPAPTYNDPTSYTEPGIDTHEPTPIQYSEPVVTTEVDETMEEEAPHEQYEQNYENYEQNYEQSPVADTEYQNQYDPNYQQQEYAEGQYENYDQYQQQYVDPNAQYEGNYENYAVDPNYQTEQALDNNQYNTDYQEPQYQENANTQPKDDKNGKGSNSTVKLASNNGKVASDSSKIAGNSGKMTSNNGKVGSKSGKVPSQS